MSENDYLHIESYAAPFTLGAARCMYWFLPAASIRSCCDSLFPDFAKNAVADSASGYMHRFKAGHDLLTDVVMSPQDLSAKLHHAGHILLTDFPTKAGIPIPGFSQNGLGQMLVEWGIPKGWMCLNIADAGIGLCVLPEGAEDVLSAISGDLPFDSFWTFFDTFGEGCIELVGAVVTENPLLLIASAENIAAGIISLGRELNPFLNIESFLGATFAGFAIGCAATLLTSRDKSPRELAENFYYRSARSLTWGALSSISPILSLGGCAGCIAYYWGKTLARKRQSGSFNPEMAASIFQASLEENPAFRALQEARGLQTESLHEPLNSNITTLCEELERMLHQELSLHDMKELHTHPMLHDIRSLTDEPHLHESPLLH